MLVHGELCAGNLFELRDLKKLMQVIVSFTQTHMTDRYMYSTGTLRFLVCTVHHCMMFGTNLPVCTYLCMYVCIPTTHSVHWCHVHIVGAV